MKAKFKVIKDSKKDYVRKYKDTEMNVSYPRYKAEVEFSNKKIKLDEHGKRFGNLTYTEIEFNELIKTPKGGIVYGEDMAAQNGDMVILNYKQISKRRKLLTGITIIGSSKKKTSKDTNTNKKEVKK